MLWKIAFLFCEDAEKATTFDKRHNEIYALFILKYVVQIDQERMICCFKNISFHSQVLHLVMLNN